MDYLSHLSTHHNYSVASLNIAISALKFFYGKILHKPFIIEKKRPKKDKHLPNVLNTEEIVHLLNASINIKHRVILALVYSGGLRVS